MRLAAAVVATLLASLALAACGDDTAATVPPDLSFESAGPFPVGHVTLTVTDAARATSPSRSGIPPTRAPAPPPPPASPPRTTASATRRS
jgi:hypothetical protein